MKAIIFGAAGQDGFYLQELLKREGVRVIAVSRSEGFVKKDLTDRQEMNDFIKAEQPDYIFHFAANSTTRHEVIFENHEVISTGTLHILEAVKEYSQHTRVFISGSALQFLNEGKPISESAAFAANDPYAVSRIQTVYAARYFRKLGVKVYVGYFFNHDSYLRSERHIAKKISAAVQRIAAGSNEVLEIGDLSVIKEWSYAGDIVEAVWILVNQENIYEAVIGSGEGYSVQEWADECFAVAGLKSGSHIKKAGDFVSPYAFLVSDNKLITSLGYSPAVSFKMLAKKMMSDEQ